MLSNAFKQLAELYALNLIDLNEVRRITGYKQVPNEFLLYAAKVATEFEIRLKVRKQLYQLGW
jgi:hypothetical protein